MKSKSKIRHPQSSDDFSEKEEAELYLYLCETRPEGKVMISEAEQAEFEKRLGIKSKP